MVWGLPVNDKTKQFIEAYRRNAKRLTNGIFDEDSMMRDANDPKILEMVRSNKGITKEGRKELEDTKNSIRHEKVDELLDLIIEAEKKKKRSHNQY